METVEKRLREHIQAHEALQQQQALLTSIVGITESTAARALAKIGAIEHFTSALLVALPPSPRFRGRLLAAGKDKMQVNSI